MAIQAKIQKIVLMLEDACKCKKRHFDFGMMISIVCIENYAWISFAPLVRQFKFFIIWWFCIMKQQDHFFPLLVQNYVDLGGVCCKIAVIPCDFYANLEMTHDCHFYIVFHFHCKQFARYFTIS